jgi:uncharacterized protein (UPF0332 family)/predicted nucleotidyltransferase
MQTQALCREAAEVLARRLVQRYPEVEAVVLFGSVARGDVHEDSDVDLMIIVEGDVRQMHSRVFALAQELLDDFPDIQVQTIVEDSARFSARAIEGYPLERTVARQGVALFDRGAFATVRKSLPPQIAEDRAEYRSSLSVTHEHLRAAEEALLEACVLFENGLWDGVSNRAYYAVFNAATAAVLRTGVEDIRSHKALRNLFRHRVAEDRHLGLDLAVDLDRLLDLRLNADYKRAFRVSEQDAEAALETAERFIGRVRDFVSAP